MMSSRFKLFVNNLSMLVQFFFIYIVAKHNIQRFYKSYSQQTGSQWICKITFFALAGSFVGFSTIDVWI